MTKRAMIVLGASPAKTVKAIEKAGGTVLANYGQSALVSAEEEVLTGLTGKGMRMRMLGPKGEAAVGPHRVAMARVAMSAAEITAAAPGSRHYLVDLAGPIHQDWKSTWSIRACASSRARARMCTYAKSKAAGWPKCRRCRLSIPLWPIIRR